MDPRFVQGFVDELQRQGSMRKRGVGPTNLDDRPAAGPTPKARYVPPPASSLSPATAAGLGLGPIPVTQARPIQDRRPEVNTGAPDYSGASQWAMRAVPGSSRPVNGVNSGPLLPPANVLPYVPPAPHPPVVDPGMAGSTVDPFVTEQNTRDVVTGIRGERLSADAAPHVAETTRIQNEIRTLSAEQDGLNPGDPEQYPRYLEIDTQIAELGNQLSAETAAVDDIYGIPGFGMSLVGTVLEVAGEPARWAQGGLGQIGWWVLDNADNPYLGVAINGALSTVPGGQVAVAELNKLGIGPTDYVDFVQEHRAEAETIRAEGYTAEDGTVYAPGDGNGLWAFYTDSLNLGQEVVAGTWSDPTSYLAVGRSLGNQAGRWADDAAIQAGRETAATRLARGAGQAVALPQRVIDEPLDRGIAAVGRGVRGIVPDSWLETPLGAQVANIVQRIDNTLRNENVGRRQVAEGETSARRGVGADQREFADSSVPYDASPQPEVVPPPVLPITPIPPYQAVPVGDITPLRPLPGRAGIDASQWQNGRPPMAAPPLDPALPPGPIRPPDPYTGLMNDYTEALRMGDEAGAEAIARRMNDMQAEDAVDYDVTANPPASAAPVDVEAPTPPSPRYAAPDDVPIRDNPNFRRGTGPAEVGEGENLLVVDRSDDGKRWTIYGGDEYPNYPSRSAAITVARREVVRIDAEAVSGGIARTSPVDALTGEDFLAVRELDDGTFGAFLDGDDVPLVEAATREEVQRAVADIGVDDLPTGQATLPTDPQTQWRQFGVGKPKMVDSVLDQADDYAARGLAPQVDRWLRWREDFVEDLNASRGTPSTTTPSLQSVTDRAEEEIAFARIVGEAPPEQVVSFEDVPADQIRRMPVSSSVAEMAERAMFGDDAVATQARGWFRKQKNKKIAAAVDPEFGRDVRTFMDAADYLKWLRGRRDEAVRGGGEQIELMAAGLPINLPSIRDAYRAIGDRATSGRRLKRARMQVAKQEAAARRRSELPSGTTRRPILSDAEDRLLNTRIADLGKVGRADAVVDGVVKPRVGGDTETVRSVYDPARQSALARGLSEEEAHREGMKAVTSRIEADFGLADAKGAGNKWDAYTNYVTMMARYGTPIATARSIQTDMVGDFMQAFLREGPITAAQMVARTAGYVRRGFKWEDTRLGEMVGEWGYDVKSLSPREGIVKAEIAGTSVKSPVRRVLAPKFGKFDLDKNILGVPGKIVSKPAEWGRYANDQLEMGRRTTLKASIIDSTLMREKKSLPAKLRADRRVAGVNISDDDLTATIEDLGMRFSPEDVRLAMERLAVSKGANPKRAANFGITTGKRWANIKNVVTEDAAKRVNKALFSYEFTNADVWARRFIPFHYWSSRAIPFYVETAIRNPAFALAYYRLAEGLSERSEAEGWPASLRFMVKIWSGPMGYIFFADPVANLGLLGVTEMLYPNEFDDGQTSTVGRWLQTASGRGGVGVTPAITAMMGYMGLMGEDTYALDFTGTRPVRNLIGAVLQIGAAEVGDPTLLDRPVDELFMAGRAYASRWASKWIPGAREIPATDPQSYPKQQIRNGMVDMLMQERGYTSISQMTDADWEVINTQFEEADGPLYEEAVRDYAWSSFAREGVRVLSGPVSVRQEGQFARQTQDRRQNPLADANAVPGEGATPVQEYESQANLGGRYGRTEGGLSLPQYDPYADYTLTPGEVQFMELWYQETGERYEEGDLEAFRERSEFSETMLRTTPEAAPYVAGEIGYYNLGPESAAPLLDQYYNIAFANPDTGMVVISGREWGPQRLSALTSDERFTLADAWLQERDADGSARRTLQMREAWKDAHPEYARYKDWDKEVGNAWEGNLAGYRQEVSRGNPNAARYFENQARLAREEVGADASPQEYQAELDRRTTNLGAYLAVHGIQRTLDDPRPAPLGDPSDLPGPFDPRPAGWASEGDGAGGDPAGGGAGGSGPSAGSTTRSREEWATETIGATESGVAQANALLTQEMGYPVDIALLPPPIRDQALAMLPPGLIPDDSWLYFDFKAWQSHQQLMGGPTDLLSYLAATANDRDWKARRTTSSAGGATLVGSTPAEVYTGPPAGQAPPTETRSIPGGSYAAYLAGG